MAKAIAAGPPVPQQGAHSGKSGKTQNRGGATSSSHGRAPRLHARPTPSPRNSLGQRAHLATREERLLQQTMTSRTTALLLLAVSAAAQMAPTDAPSDAPTDTCGSCKGCKVTCGSCEFVAGWSYAGPDCWDTEAKVPTAWKTEEYCNVNDSFGGKAGEGTIWCGKGKAPVSPTISPTWYHGFESDDAWCQTHVDCDDPLGLDRRKSNWEVCCGNSGNGWKLPLEMSEIMGIVFCLCSIVILLAAYVRDKRARRAILKDPKPDALNPSPNALSPPRADAV
jgi:hypothetical protein